MTDAENATTKNAGLEIAAADCKGGQEAQPSQRDRAMLRVTEYFTKSLKVTQGH